MVEVLPAAVEVETEVAVETVLGVETDVADVTDVVLAVELDAVELLLILVVVRLVRLSISSSQSPASIHRSPNPSRIATKVRPVSKLSANQLKTSGSIALPS